MSEEGTEIERILRQAIRFEESAYGFYTGAMAMVEQPHVKQTMQELADEEVKHKERLEGLLEGDAEAIIAVRKQSEIQDLKLADYLVPRPLETDATFEDVLIVAMHREKSSHDFYTAMASLVEAEASKKLFEFLAQEELEHKNKVEALYDEVVYKEF